MVSVSALRFTKMDANTLEAYLNFAVELTEKADEIFVEGFYGEKIIECKNGRPWDLVTDYDKKIEQLIMDSIKEAYPSHLVIAEEETAAKGKKGLVLTQEPTWLIDPIDGTYNYAHGLPLTCISIGLAINREVVVGVVYNPLSKSRYTAIKGQGAFINGRPIHVSKQQGLDSAIVSFELSMIRFPAIREKNTKRYMAVTDLANGVRIIGSAALTLCMVAAGGIDLFFHQFLQPWDLAAGCLILQEAGGYACHQEGEDYTTMGNNIIAAANKNIADELLDIFKKSS